MRGLLVALCLFLSQSAYATHIVSKAAHIDITTDKAVTLKGAITFTSARKLVKEMLSTLGNKGQRVVILNSPGGMVEAGKIIIEAIRAEQQIGPVVCIADKEASSMAFNIISYCDVRLATAKTHSVVHKIRVAFPPGVMLTSRRLREVADALDKSDEPFRRNNARRMHISLADYDLFADKETAWRVETLVAKGYYAGVCTIDQ